jgi:ATP-dependent phosphoenolpyruvate carboxykinase
MTKFILQAIQNNSDDFSEEPSKLTKEFEAGTWPEALEQFVLLLKGAGYFISESSVGVNKALHPSAAMVSEYYGHIVFFEQVEE